MECKRCGREAQRFRKDRPVCLECHAQYQREYLAQRRPPEKDAVPVVTSEPRPTHCPHCRHLLVESSEVVDRNRYVQTTEHTCVYCGKKRYEVTRLREYTRIVSD